MTEDERVNWLTVAYDQVKDIPGKPFLKACETVRVECDHPRHIVPMIVDKSKGWADSLRAIHGGKPQTTIPHENRLRGPVERTGKPQPIGGETSKILSELKAKAKGERVNL